MSNNTTVAGAITNTGGMRCHLGRRGGVVHFEAAEPSHVTPVEATIEQMSRVEDNDAGGQCRAQARGCAAPPFLQM